MYSLQRLHRPLNPPPPCDTVGPLSGRLCLSPTHRADLMRVARIDEINNREVVLLAGCDVARVTQVRMELPPLDHRREDPSSPDRKSTRLNSSHIQKSRMPSSA